MGLRFKKVEAGTTTYYIDRIYEHVETASLDQTLRHYIGGSIVQSIARPFGNPTGNQTTSFVHVDRLGSTELVTPGTAAELATVIAMNTLERHAFDPYGAPRNGDWTDGTGVWGSPATPRGFTSHEHLDANQLVHMNGRVYDPGLGRFLSVDLLVGVPLSTQSYNRYGYLLGNPTSGIDPSGFFPQIYTSDKDIEEIVITCDRECQRRAIAKQDHTLHPWDRNFLTPQLGGRRLSAARGDQRTISVDTGSPLRRRVVDERLDPVQAEFDRNTEALIRMEAARIGVVPEALAPGITTEGLGDDLLELGAELAEGLAYAGDPHELKWEHRDEYGHLVGEGLQLSGGTHPGRRLNRREQTDRHSEPLLFAPRPWLPEEGHRWSLVGQKDPCSNCKAVLKARSLFGAEISYYSLESRRTFYYREGEQFFYPRPSRRINLIGTSLGGLRARTTRR